MYTHTPARRPYGLIVSILLNALLAGVLIGGHLGGHLAPYATHSAGTKTRAGAFEMLQGMDRALAKDTRRSFRQSFRQSFANSREERESLSAARQRLQLALAREPYDREAVQQAFGQLNRAELALKIRIQTTLTEEMDKLTPQQRQALIRLQGPSPRARQGPKHVE